jgi:outer membrane beta-barrel protein
MRTLLSLCLALSLLPAVAYGRRENPLEGQPAVRHRVELRKGRFEIGPDFNFSLNRYVRNAFLVGAKLEYHIVDWFSIGATFGYGIGFDSALVGEVQKTYAASVSGDQSAAFDKLHNRFSDIQLAGDIRAIFTPIAGKLGLFSKLFVAYDTYIFAGFGFALTKNGCSGDAPGNCYPTGSSAAAGDDIDAATKGFRPGISWGLGFRLYFNRFVAMGVEMKDIVFSDNEFGGDMTRGQTDAERAAGNKIFINGDDKKFSNHFFAGINLTFFLPPSAEISR